MTIKNYIDKTCAKEIEEITHLTIQELISFMQDCDEASMYITNNKKLLYTLQIEDFINIIKNNLLTLNIKEYINNHPKEIIALKEDENIIDAHYFMRSKRLQHIAIIDKDNNLLGELNFKTLSSKIADIAIKDELTGLYNKKYLDVLIQEYKNFDKEIGIIMFGLENIGLIEKFYGITFVNELLKVYGNRIKRSIRDIDFTFRIDYRFVVITFNNLEITDKMRKRIVNNLEKTELNGVKLTFKHSIAHYPETDNNILLALNRCEENLINP